VCSQADRIAMNPAGGLRFSGLSSTYTYFGGLLKKLGVKADFVRIGGHKLAAEQFTLSGGSESAHQDHQEVVGQLVGVYLRDIGAGRHLAEGDLKRRLAKGPFLASEARAAGLIDTLAYEDEVERLMVEVMGRPVRVVDDRVSPSAPSRWGAEPKIA